MSDEGDQALLAQYDRLLESLSATVTRSEAILRSAQQTLDLAHHALADAEHALASAKQGRQQVVDDAERERSPASEGTYTNDAA